MPEVTEVEAADPTYMEISTLRFTLAQPGTSAAAAEEAKGKLSALVEKHSMAPFYKLVCEQLGWPVDAAKLAAMEKVNAAELESLGEKIKNAEENEGESEIREAYLVRPSHEATTLVARGVRGRPRVHCRPVRSSS